MTPKKIVYGICGIGNGHTFRQLPVLTHLAEEGHQIVVFAYDASYAFYKKHLQAYPNVTIEEVAVPFYAGNATGLDFEAIAGLPANRKDFLTINAKAMAAAQAHIGKPDLVISDYEPVSAQYGYAHGAPLITIDQQSKYLAGQFPEPLHGQTYQDEIMRLRMFFPLAEKRLACSFFRVPKSHKGPLEEVEIVPPVLRDEVIKLKDQPKTSTLSMLVYLTAQQPLNQSLEEIVTACKAASGAEMHIFVPKSQTLPKGEDNVHFYHHGDPRFDDILGGCHGVVSTAGHTLLSEAMSLGIPVYAMPLNLYEQQMNAHVIQENGFGVSQQTLTADKLTEFATNLPRYAGNIANDTQTLLRNSGQGRITACIDQVLQGLLVRNSKGERASKS